MVRGHPDRKGLIMPTFADLSPYTFGAMSLGADGDRIEQDIALVRRVMEAGLSIHCSPTYNRGISFMALRCAFDEAPSRRPPLIIKIRDASIRWLRFEVEDCRRRLGIDTIDIAQLVAMDRSPGNLIDQLQAGSGPIHDALAELRQQGMINRVALFCNRANAAAAARAVSASPLADGLICYWNVRQRELCPEALALIAEQDIPVLALRTLAGAKEPSDDDPLPSIIRNAGCQDQVDLALRLAASWPALVTTIGGTANHDHCERFIAAAQDPAPLPQAIMARIDALRDGS